MKEFEFDLNKISFTKTGEKVIEYYDEYQKASNLVKDAILIAIKGLTCYSQKVTNLFKGTTTKEEFLLGLADIKTLINKNCKKERQEAARKFVSDYVPEEMEIRILEDESRMDKIIVRKMVGLKSTTLKQYFDFFDLETGKENEYASIFKEKKVFLKDFMNYYIRKKIVNFIDPEGLKAFKFSYTVEISEAICDRWVDINIDYILDINHLNTDLIDKVISEIKSIESTDFFE